MLKPILKWAGGKRQLLPQIHPRLPNYIRAGSTPYCYLEPFPGGGALAWHLLNSENPPQVVWLNDCNEDLMNVYRVIQQIPEKLITALAIIQAEYDARPDLTDKKPYFYARRDLFNSRKSDALTQAALFIFLNRAGFNGLCRVNRDNQSLEQRK